MTFNLLTLLAACMGRAVGEMRSKLREKREGKALYKIPVCGLTG